MGGKATSKVLDPAGLVPKAEKKLLGYKPSETIWGTRRSPGGGGQRVPIGSRNYPSPIVTTPTYNPYKYSLLGSTAQANTARPSLLGL